MKTIAIFSGYHLPHLGGIERYTDNLSKQLVKQGYKVVIISSDYNFDKNYINDSGNPILLKLPVYKLFVSRYPIMRHNKDFKDVIKYLDTLKIDAIIVNTRFHLTSLEGAKYGHKRAIPVFLIEHGSEHLTIDNKVLDYFGAHYEHALTNIVKKYVDYYYGVSREACNWQKHFKINSNGVWYNSINDFSSNYKITRTDKKIVFTYAGRVIKQKGLLELVNSFKKLEKEYKNIELNIAGAGNYLDELKEIGKSKNIKFLGKLGFDELCKYYAKTDVFTYPSMHPEGLPTSVLEAGIMGCAVITTPFGGSKEIVTDNETGLIITNEDELYVAMKKLIDDKKLRERLSNNLIKKIKKEFVWDSTAKKIIKDIKGVLNEN